MEKLGSLPGLDGKTLLLQILHTLDTGHRNEAGARLDASSLLMSVHKVRGAVQAAPENSHQQPYLCVHPSWLLPENSHQQL